MSRDRKVEWTPERGRRVLDAARARAAELERELAATRNSIEVQERLLAEAGQRT